MKFEPPDPLPLKFTPSHLNTFRDFRFTAMLLLTIRLQGILQCKERLKLQHVWVYVQASWGKPCALLSAKSKLLLFQMNFIGIQYVYIIRDHLHKVKCRSDSMNHIAIVSIQDQADALQNKYWLIVIHQAKSMLVLLQFILHINEQLNEIYCRNYYLHHNEIHLGKKPI